MKTLLRMIVFFGAAIPTGLGVWELSGRVNIPQDSSWWSTVQFFIVTIASVAAGTVALAELREFVDSTDARIMNWRASVATTLAIAIVVQVFMGILIVGGVAVVSGSQTSSLPTPIPTVTRNSDWIPIIKAFDNVEMALVPMGCFMMGEGNEAHEQCFDKPFWIDRYEVTYALYGKSSRIPDHPVETVSWSSALDFCIKRNARLPTEKEWEYAARGPDNLIYPWGNNFIPDNLTYMSNSNSVTRPVGSHPNGQSWVGAHDMLGNAWEWTSSLAQPYPYNPADGREDYSKNNSDHIIRGGGRYTDVAVLYSSYRKQLGMVSALDNIGFRCARDFQPGDLLP